ncbi:MAG TPA: Rap1a/Tai family immunity protein [Burkholderiales bacterium]|nr:Rap1a/Tai family immunity protein [Burkholderiales bacterium]
MTRSRLSIQLAVCLVALLTAAAAATANDAYLKGNFTGAQMLKYCKVANDDSVRDFERGVCTGFIDGFAAGHHAAELWHAFHHRDEDIDNIFGHLCVPKDANRTALVALFVRYLESNPDNLDWSAGLLLESALREAYPCEEEN